MPIYEYRCTACGQEFEVIQKLSDRPLRKCKECNGKLEKLLSRTSFRLKGGGWFVNDYSGSAGSTKKTSSGAAPAAKEASGGSDKGSSSSD